jgi:hypothetical protein
VLQGLEPAPVGPFGRRVPHQVLRYPQGEPEREDPFPSWPAAGLRQQGEQGARRRIPPVHASAFARVAKTRSGTICFMHR